MRQRSHLRASLSLAAALLMGCLTILHAAQPVADPDPTPRTPRPAKWAQPVAAKHLTNFYKVTDNLYRSAQPDADAQREAKALGIRTVINLRFFHSDAPTSGTEGVAADRIPQNAWHVEDEDIVKFLRLVTNEKNAPFLVHCQHGADRTGVACAMYRIVIQGWSKEDAIDEMTHGGYGFHSVWSNIVDYIRDVDVAKIRLQVDKKETPEVITTPGVPRRKIE